MNLSITLNVGPAISGKTTGIGILSNAKVVVTNTSQIKQSGKTDNNGKVTFENLDAGCYKLTFPNLPAGWDFTDSNFEISIENKDVEVTYTVNNKNFSGLALEAIDVTGCPTTHITQGQGFWIRVTLPSGITAKTVDCYAYRNGGKQSCAQNQGSVQENVYVAQVLGVTDTAGPLMIAANVGLVTDQNTEGSGEFTNIVLRLTNTINVDESKQIIGGQVNTTTSLTRTETSFTEDTAFWTAIRNSTEALSFNNYFSFMNQIFCDPKGDGTGSCNKYNELLTKRFLPFTDSDTYRVVKVATEAFVMVNCGVLAQKDCNGLSKQPFNPDLDNAYLSRRDLPTSQNLSGIFNSQYLVGVNDNRNVLPYLAVIRRKLPDIPINSIGNEQDNSGRDADVCYGLLQEKLANPCLLELIWSYWHEEGMLVQTSNAITRRFQNVRSSGQDPLASMEMDPLRPLNNLLWGYIQDEQHRLTVNRRNYEYDHHYGLRLEGRAVQNFRPADTRSKFLEAFHHLLRLCTVFYKQDDDTTVKADAFPVLNALKEVHLILSQGAHNQFGDLPSTARIEMLMQQWMLARPEFRELLPTRVMVAYPEPWMDRVDAMKKLQGWTDTSVLHFRNLGMFGEQLLLSIRWGNWSDEFEPVKALNWARFFRPQVQGYIHAYRAATGVDLSADPIVNARVDSTLPSVLLQKRLASQQRAI